MKQMEYLLEEMTQMAKLGAALGVLGWDKEVYMPSAASPFRGEVTAMLAGELHKRTTAPKFVNTLKELAEPTNLKSLSPDEQIIVRETWRDVERAVKLPVEFVEELARVSNNAFAAWVEARKQSDFAEFKPHLAKIIALCRKEAGLLGYKGSPYNALLEDYEPFMTTDKLDALFDPLAKELSSLVKSATKNPPSLPKRKYDLAKQEQFCQRIAQKLGYDFSRGRLDKSPHPFTTGFHPTDVRITTRYDENDFWVALGAAIHETGHALYEQGLPPKDYATPLGSAASLGVHESQSRIWENFVGRSRAFTSYIYPQLSKQFGGLPYDEDELYRWLNRVEPSLIRVEADEVTYNLHIVIRYELEKALIEDKLPLDELPQAWRQKTDDYLGIKVPSDAQGVLQDVHWSHGSFGYFPTYTLGNVYSAQLYHAIARAVPNLEKNFATGDFEPFLAWLRKNIHQHGRRYAPEELIERASGESITSEYLLDYLRAKIKA